jgi:N-acyl-D-amino-acid deacylase
MTNPPATNRGLAQRGQLKEGCFADIVVFDPDTIADKATYAAQLGYQAAQLGYQAAQLAYCAV